MSEQSETILIVDDEFSIRRLLAAKLKTEGYRCLQAENVEAAGYQLASNHVDAVLLDINMPGKPGIHFLSEIKATYPDVAVIMATAVSETNTAINCMRMGADDYISKPFSLEELSVSVQKALEKRRLQLEIKHYQLFLENKVNEQTADIRKLFLGAIESLVAALEAKDRYTAGHSRRVAELAVAIGVELGLSETDIEDLRWGGLLHDVGKIAVDQLVQNKPGRLTTAEYEHIMIHAHVGAGIVRPVVNERVVEMIEHHHDHFDGRGLHQRERGTDIPLAARILAVADAYDAMSSERPYRKAMSSGDAAAEIKRCIGTQFDPVVSTAFLKSIDFCQLLAAVSGSQKAADLPGQGDKKWTQ
jgi:putative two-component system response regulator